MKIARCYLPQPEDGEYPGREFVEALEESASATLLPVDGTRK
jgi:hypothetical protein